VPAIDSVHTRVRTHRPSPPPFITIDELEAMLLADEQLLAGGERVQVRVLPGRSTLNQLCTEARNAFG
jgi:predicted DNA-binding protein (UPF0251 family)